jgi:hypothetical protein
VTKAPKPQPDAGPLLSSVAAALTACEQAGIAVKFKHGTVWTDLGYVIQIGEKTWAARTLAYTEFPPSGSYEYEDD